MPNFEGAMVFSKATASRAVVDLGFARILPEVVPQWHVQEDSLSWVQGRERNPQFLCTFDHFF
jgi:hypothetical protein